MNGRVARARMQLRNHLRDLWLNTVIASPLLPKPLRWRMLRASGLPVSQSLIPPRTFFGSTRVAIGPRTFINYGCFFDALEWIRIGADCQVAMGATFITSSHRMGGPERRAGLSARAPIEVQDGCWIGANVTVLPGVTIGRGTVVAAGAVVTTDCEPDSVYGGVPAKKIRSLS